MRYMLLIYGEEVGADAEAMRDMAPWIAYSTWLVEQGLYLAGDPLEDSATATTVRVRDGQRLITDGPFAETKEVLGGYYLIEAPDLDRAIEAAARCPGALWGSMEVRPLGTMPGTNPAGAPA